MMIAVHSSVEMSSSAERFYPQSGCKVPSFIILVQREPIRTCLWHWNFFSPKWSYAPLRESSRKKLNEKNEETQQQQKENDHDEREVHARGFTLRYQRMRMKLGFLSIGRMLRRALSLSLFHSPPSAKSCSNPQSDANLPVCMYIHCDAFDAIVTKKVLTQRTLDFLGGNE